MHSSDTSLKLEGTLTIIGQAQLGQDAAQSHIPGSCLP
jgi:hypothetical protein